jgi:hypothetical protein
MRCLFTIIVTSVVSSMSAYGEPVSFQSDDPNTLIKLVYQAPRDGLFSAIKHHNSTEQDEDNFKMLDRYLEKHSLLGKIYVIIPSKGDGFFFIGKRPDIDTLEKLLDKIGAKDFIEVHEFIAEN